MILTITTIIALYCVFVGVLVYGWLSVPPCKKEKTEIRNFYSVIIPVRNEERNVPIVCRALLTQQFPTDHYEILFVNDHSVDSTAEVITRLIKESAPAKMRLLELKKGMGKKDAIQLAISEAKGEIIVTTDADCSPSPYWLRNLSRCYEQSSRIQMVFGPVAFNDDNTFFKQLQTIEFAALIGTGVATLALGSPTMCNGANLSYKKASFFAVNGYLGNEDLATGDDEFLMHKVHRKFPGQVLFSKSKESVVFTQAHDSWSAFFQQRKRWASKWRHYSSVKISLLAVFIFIFNIAFITAVGLLVFDFHTYSPLLIPVLSKSIIETAFLFIILKFLGKSIQPILFLFLQFTYPFYVVIFGIAANFGKYTWKGRHH